MIAHNDCQSQNSSYGVLSDSGDNMRIRTLTDFRTCTVIVKSSVTH